jgi:hypothetical protein
LRLHNRHPAQYRGKIAKTSSGEVLRLKWNRLPFEEKQSRPGTGYWFSASFFEYAALAGADEHAPRRRWFGERQKSEDQVGLLKGSRSVRARGNAAAQRAAITQNPCAPKRA